MSDIEAAPTVVDLEPVIRRVIGARVADRATVDDLTQETLVRVMAVQDRLDPSAHGPYAIVTACNLIRSGARNEERHQRLAPGLFDPRRPDDPEERALAAEDHRALAAALDQLSAEERDALVAHDVEGVQTGVLAEQLGVSPGAISLRLLRTRARLRVDYLLALRRTELPTPNCKPVLLALSVGDKRRQLALATGQHLVACPPCFALSKPLLERRRPLAALWPALALGRLTGWLRRQARAHPGGAGATGVAAVAAVALLAFSLRGGPPRPVLFVQRDPPIELSGDKPLAPYAGRTVRAEGVTVESVPTDEGFWVGRSRTDRVWVDLDTGEPVSEPVQAGQRVTFQGTLIANHAELPSQLGLEAPADRAQLERQGHHISIDEATLQIVSTSPPNR